MNELFEFLKDTGEEQDLLTQPLDGEPAKEPEEEGQHLRNRRERRLAERLKAERESSIALAAKLEVLTNNRNETPDKDYLKSIERIYGTDSQEAQDATELLKNALRGVEERATENALAKFREEQAATQQATAKESKALDSMIEDIEDDYNVELSGPQGETTRKAFFKLLERMSPKDSDGNVTQYADHRAVWETLKAQHPKQESRARDIATRSMTQSGSPQESKLVDDAQTRYLRENGII